MAKFGQVGPPGPGQDPCRGPGLGQGHRCYGGPKGPPYGRVNYARPQAPHRVPGLGLASARQVLSLGGRIRRLGEARSGANGPPLEGRQGQAKGFP